MNELPEPIDLPPVPDSEGESVRQSQCEHTWAAEPNADDAHRHVCVKCGAEKSDAPF